MSLTGSLADLMNFRELKLLIWGAPAHHLMVFLRMKKMTRSTMKGIMDKCLNFKIIQIRLEGLSTRHQLLLHRDKEVIQGIETRAGVKWAHLRGKLILKLNNDYLQSSFRKIIYNWLTTKLLACLSMKFLPWQARPLLISLRDSIAQQLAQWDRGDKAISKEDNLPITKKDLLLQ